MTKLDFLSSKSGILFYNIGRSNQSKGVNMTISQKDLISFLSENIEQLTVDLSHTLDGTFKNLCNVLFYTPHIMKLFLQEQGFTQISASLSNKRHAFWYKCLADQGFPISFNDASDLKMDESTLFGIRRCLIEVKGAASTSDKYGAWQGGKTYRQLENEKLFLLSQELYDVDRLCLSKLRVVIAFVDPNGFESSMGDIKTNRTYLSYNSLVKTRRIIVEYEIDVNQQLHMYA
jgi:hypothetical protein